MKNGKKDELNHNGQQHGHHNMQDDSFKAENHKEHIAFLKDRYGMSVYSSDDVEKRHEEGGGPTLPVDLLFKSGKDEKKIEESLDRSYELTREAMGKRVEGMNRRNFIKLAFLASAGVGLAAISQGCLEYTPWYGHVDTYKQINFDRPLDTDSSKVTVAKGSSIETIVRNAVTMAGGLSLIKPGEYVLIKPNCVWFSDAQTVPWSEELEAQVTTNPEVLRHVIRMVKERTNRKNIWVADHAAWMSSTEFVMRQQGIYDVCMQEGVNACSMGDWEHIAFTSDKFEWMNQPFNIAEKMLRVDHMINVPKLKNHNMPVIRDMAQYTCCMKSFVGVLAPNNRLFTTRFMHMYNLPEKAVELNLCRPWHMENGTTPGITMNVVDATDIIVSGGPHNSIFLEEMKVAHPNMIIASKDRVACDTVAVAVLKHYGKLKGVNRDYMHIPVWAQRQIRHGAKLGLGINDANRIEIGFTGVDNLEKNSILDIWNEGRDLTTEELNANFPGPTPYLCYE